MPPRGGFMILQVICTNLTRDKAKRIIDFLN